MLNVLYVLTENAQTTSLDILNNRQCQECGVVSILSQESSDSASFRNLPTQSSYCQLDLILHLKSCKTSDGVNVLLQNGFSAYTVMSHMYGNDLDI